MCGSIIITHIQLFIFYYNNNKRIIPPTKNNNNFEQPKHSLPDWFPAAAKILFVSAGSRGGKPIQLEVQIYIQTSLSTGGGERYSVWRHERREK